jgi:hypothetical protein
MGFKMKHIFVSDIFGETIELTKLCNLICRENAYQIISPYSEKVVFKSEQQAYQYFVEQIGLEEYFNHLSYQLGLIEEPFTLIGFSIGASVCWQYLAQQQAPFLKDSVLFYGSQIRNMSGLEPLVETLLIFPKSEPHFKVEQLVINLQMKRHTEVIRSDFLHGFMNELSINYDELASQYFITKLNSDI